MRKLTPSHTPGNLRQMNDTHGAARTIAVVLNWCAEEDTAACVESLLADRTPELDVLIVDNDSVDGSGARLASRFSSLGYLQTGANLGYAGGNQRAIEWAMARGYDFVLICNDDAELRPGCVQAMLVAIRDNPRVAACAPTIVHPGDDAVIWWAGGRWQPYKAMGTHESYGRRLSEVLAAHDAPEPATFLSGCVLLLRVKALRACGGFREEFFAYVEDLELSVRLHRAGWTLLWVPHAVALHKVPYPAPEASPFAIRLRDVNRRRLVALRYGWLQALAFAAWFYPTRVAHLLRYTLRGDRGHARAIIAGMFDSIRVPSANL